MVKSFQVKAHSLNFIDVFSGAGGLSCGLEMAGHKCLLGIDFDKFAIESFKINHPHAFSFCGDIRQLKNKELLSLLHRQPVHAVVGGPPCQGFSTVGIGDPKDQRNSLFLEFVRVVKLTSPIFIIIENVTGLVAKKNEGTLKAIFNEFEKLGYHLDVQVLSAENFGVPEKRRRTIILGTKLKTKIIFPEKREEIATTVGDAFLAIKNYSKELFNHDIGKAQIKNELDRARMHHIPEGKGIRYEKDEKTYLPKKLRLGIDWENIRENRLRQTKYQRLDRRLPSPTIMTHRHGYYHPTEDRYLTAREAASLQSFPLDFRFMGPLHAQWRQIGNAVPPLLGKALGEALQTMYKNAKRKSATKVDPNKNIQIQNVRSRAFVYKKTINSNK